jgi:hypothetical protein
MEAREWRALLRRLCRCWGRSQQVHAIVPGNEASSHREDPQVSRHFDRVESWEEGQPVKASETHPSAGQLPTLSAVHRSTIITPQPIPVLQLKPPMYGKRPSSHSESVSFCESSIRVEAETPPAPHSQRTPSSLELRASLTSVASAGSDRELFREMAEELEVLSH